MNAARRRTTVRQTVKRQKTSSFQPVSTRPQAQAFARRNGSVQQRRKVKTRAEQGYKASSRPTAQAGTAQLRIRALMLAFFLCCGFSAVGVQLGHVALIPAHEPRAAIRELPVTPVRRGNIYDANGVLLATTLTVPSVFVDPQRMLNKAESLQKLAKILPQLNVQKLTRLTDHPRRRFVWVRRQITPEQAYEINQLGLPGVGFREEDVRVYPQHNLAAHVLGGIGVDGNGLAGIESAKNDALNHGKDVHLTLDARIQQQLAASLAGALKETGAKGAWGVVLDAEHNDIRAMVSLPDYNPNEFGNAPSKAKFNPMTFGRFEMGSTFKLFTLAQGLAEGHITPESKIDATKPLKIGKYTINDFHAQRRVLTALEVLRHSSNIGAATIAEMYGAEGQQAFFRQLGLLDTLDVGLPETIAPSYPSHWGRVHTITAAYGHGIAVTPLQLVAAVATLATDGHYRKPRLLQGQAYDAPRRVIQAKPLADIKMLMRDVVQQGSGWRTKIAGLDIGGKTGTAEKVGAGGYSHKKNLVSFVGAVPLENPKFVALVMLDEPQKGFETAGRSAVPAFKSFLQKSAPLFALAPQEEPPVHQIVAR